MSDKHFRSGPWTGFFNYTGPEDRHRMDLALTFEKGRMTGEGADCVGQFVIDGTYDETKQDCRWRKTYIGAHTVYYSGFADGNGIWGQWMIIPGLKGGFHIWPLAHGVETLEAEFIESGVDLTETETVTTGPGAARKPGTGSPDVPDASTY